MARKNLKKSITFILYLQGKFLGFIIPLKPFWGQMFLLSQVECMYRY